jgi:hypothetical protein
MRQLMATVFELARVAIKARSRFSNWRSAAWSKLTQQNRRSGVRIPEF